MTQHSEMLGGGCWCFMMQNIFFNSLFPVTQSKLNTVQVLCPVMTKEDRETLIALATAGLINWQENDGKTLACVPQIHIWNTITSDDLISFVTDVSGCLAVLLCCLNANTQVEAEVVHAVLATMMEWRNSREDWFLFSW